MLETMWKLFNKAIPDYDGKICIPLSGGLDSRVIAGIIAQRRKIDLSYCQWFTGRPRQTTLTDLGYAFQISKLCQVKGFEPVKVDNPIQEDLDAVKGIPLEKNLLKSRMYTGLRILNERVDLSEYTIICGHGVDSFTGVHVNPEHLFNYKKYDDDMERKMKVMFESIFPATYGKFAKWDCPLWDRDLIDFCVGLPFKYRFHQYLYRQMIQKYLPELAQIKRSGIHVPMTIGETHYFAVRVKHWVMKQTLRSKQ